MLLPRHLRHIRRNQHPNFPKPGSNPKMANAINDWPKFKATSKNASSA